MGLFDVKPDHTVIIDNKYGFYASEPDPEQPYREKNIEEVEIDNGPNKSFETNEILRKFTFKHIVNNVNVTTVRNALEPLNKGTHDFSSVYIGAFKARIRVRVKYQDRYPDVTWVEFTVTEVED